MRERRQFHLLHIDKTGGNAIWAAVRASGVKGFTRHGHEIALRDIPRGEKVIFCIREPISRFVSGFNCRLREGKPRLDRPWTAPERAAFSIFPTPESLAIALSSDDEATRIAAGWAMRSVGHVSRPLTHWFTVEELRDRRDDLAYILLQPRLERDFDRMVRRLGVSPDCRIPADPVARHETPEGFVTELSQTARANIRQWYAAEDRLYRECLEIRKGMIGKG